MKLSRYEQETIINFNAGEEMATVYTRDPAVMRRLDALVIEFPDVYRLVSVRRHIVGGVNRTLISALSPLRLCRIGTCRRLQTE